MTKQEVLIEVIPMYRNGWYANVRDAVHVQVFSGVWFSTGEPLLGLALMSLLRHPANEVIEID